MTFMVACALIRLLDHKKKQMATPAENPQQNPEQPFEPMYATLDVYRAAKDEWDNLPSGTGFGRDYAPKPPEPRLTLENLRSLSSEDLQRVDQLDVHGLYDSEIFSLDPDLMSALPYETQDHLRDEQLRRAESMAQYTKTKWFKEFLADHPEAVANFPAHAKAELSYWQRKGLEAAQRKQQLSSRRRGHLALVNEVQQAAENGAAVIDDDNSLPFPWQQEPEMPPAQEIRFMSEDQLKALDVGYLDEDQTRALSARRAELRKFRDNRPPKAPEFKPKKSKPESTSDDGEKSGAGKFWSGVAKVARQFKPSEIADRTTRGFVDKDSGTPEGEESPFASQEWQAYTEARRAKKDSKKAPEIKGQPVKPGVAWEIDTRRQEPEWPRFFGMDKLLKGIEQGSITIDLGTATNAAKNILAIPANKTWEGFVWASQGMGKLSGKLYEWVTEPVDDGERKIRVKRAAALGLFAVAAAAATIGIVDVASDPDRAQQAADAGRNTGDYVPAFDTPGVDNVTPHHVPEAHTQFDTPGIDSVDPTFKAPTKAPEFDTPGVDTVEPQTAKQSEATKAPSFDTPGIDSVDAAKAPEPPHTPDLGDTPGIDSIPGTEAVGSGEALPKDSNIWNYSSNLLEQNGYKGTDAEVAALKNWILPQTGFTEDTAHLMPSGFPMPKLSVDDLKNILGH